MSCIGVAEYVAFEVFEDFIINHNARIVYGTAFIKKSYMETFGSYYDELGEILTSPSNRETLMNKLAINSSIADWKYHKNMKRKVINFHNDCPLIFGYKEKNEKLKKIQEAIHYSIYDNPNNLPYEKFMVFYVNYKRMGSVVNHTKENKFLYLMLNLKFLKKKEIKEELIKNNFKFCPSYTKTKLIKSYFKSRPYNYNWNNYDYGVDVLKYELL